MTRHGDWIQTQSGRRFYPLDARLEDVDPRDIAHALSLVCRFAGHCRTFYCPTPDQRVLTSDLRWIPAGDLKAGDELLGFDEDPTTIGSCGKRRRRYRNSIVMTAVPVKRKTIRLVLSDGSSVVASEEHPWLVATKCSGNQAWRTVAQLAQDLQSGRRRYMHKFMEPWSTLSDYRDGWLSGMYDGEGSVSFVDRGGVQLGLAQLPGPVLDLATSHMSNLGFRFSQNKSRQSGVVNVQSLGGWRQIARLLGSVRPIRLVDKFLSAIRSGSFCKQMDGLSEPLEIVEARNDGEQWCAGLETSTHTYLCEGYGAHNSVAEHSVRVARSLLPVERPWTPAERRLALAGLLHDASEAYLGDVPRPIKRLPEMAPYREAEARLEAVIAERFGLPHPWPEAVMLADARALATEKRDLLTVQRDDWGHLPEPWDEQIVPVAPEMAESLFFDLLLQLRGVQTWCIQSAPRPDGSCLRWSNEWGKWVSAESSGVTLYPHPEEARDRLGALRCGEVSGAGGAQVVEVGR